MTPSVGDLMAAAIAAAGQHVLLLGGRVACETDFLAMCGATFPEDVPAEELERFNRETMHDYMDEAAEHRRYAKIALFFRRKA